MTEKGFGYLDKNLKPLMESITPKQSKSNIYVALGLDRISTHSILIAFGIHMETFWNKVISDSCSSINLIEDINIVEINGANKQIDHLFLVNSIKHYLESKCNVKFDSEKDKKSNEKVKQIMETVNADEGGYFIPVVSTIDQKHLTKYNNKGLSVYGTKWLLSKIDAPFTEEEYYSYLRETIAPILVEMGL